MKLADQQIVNLLQQVRDAGGGTPATGNAAVGDVALGKTFSSALLNGATGTSTKNATVPNDAPIQPPQAFVDCTITSVMLALQNGVAIDWSSKGITHFTSAGVDMIEYFDDRYGFETGTGVKINLASNPLPQADLDAILARVAILGNATGSLDLRVSAGVKPTLPVFTIDFNNLDFGSDNVLGVQGAGGGSIIEWDAGFVLNDSTVNFGESSLFIFVGRDDSPTKQQIIDKLVAIGGGKITDLGGLVIRVNPTNYALLPLDFSGMTGSSLTQGSNDIGTLRANGWTVTTN